MTQDPLPNDKTDPSVPAPTEEPKPDDYPDMSIASIFWSVMEETTTFIN